MMNDATHWKLAEPSVLQSEGKPDSNHFLAIYSKRDFLFFPSHLKGYSRAFQHPTHYLFTENQITLAGFKAIEENK